MPADNLSVISSSTLVSGSTYSMVPISRSTRPSHSGNELRARHTEPGSWSPRVTAHRVRPASAGSDLLGGRAGGKDAFMTDPVNDGTPAPTTLSISVKGLADAGLEPQLRSWVDSGPNEPVTAEQITQAVGKDELARTAESLGRAPGDLAADIALALPQLIDMASPDGSAGLVQAKVNNVVLNQTPQMVVGETESNVNYRAPLRITASGTDFTPGDYTGTVTMMFDAVPPV
ncbi:YidB family protein [Streptomyces virginiae]|uniref:YidB family protein n=2 Tax=Streptomyces virginiae TaxID=1961 RepID=UPI0036595315